MSTHSLAPRAPWRGVATPSGLLSRLDDRLNGPWHRAALAVFMGILVMHLIEHALQAIQVFVLGWPRVRALGGLGLLFPGLVTSEWLHYWFAVVTLAGLLALRRGFDGAARAWWDAALVIQVWHHFEHALLLGQALSGHNLLGRPVPTSVFQLMFPRVELHLAYNIVVAVPMLVAMALSSRPAPSVPGKG